MKSKNLVFSENCKVIIYHKEKIEGNMFSLFSEIEKFFQSESQIIISQKLLVLCSTFNRMESMEIKELIKALKNMKVIIKHDSTTKR